MNLQVLRSVPIVAALAALPAFAQAPAASSDMPPVPAPKCVAPEYPTEAGLQKRGEAYNRAVETFNRDYKTYGECMKKYVDDTNKWIKAAGDAANKAIDAYNKYTEELKKKIDAEK
jgi:DNA-binding protein